METGVSVVGIVVIGLLGILMQYRDSSFVITAHIIWFIYTYFLE